MAPPILVATAGAANANSYITLADAEVYFTWRTTATWTAAAPSNDIKTAALELATAVLDREKWLGTKGITAAGALTQALAWPRRWAPTLEYDNEPTYLDADSVWVDLTLAYYSELSVPAPIKQATCELALELLNAGTIDPLASHAYPEEGVKEKQIDVLRTVYFDPADRSRGLGAYPSVIKLVAHLLRESGATAVDRV